MRTFLRRLAILDFLRSSSIEKSTDEILNHLVSSEYIDPSEASDDAIRRMIQRDLNFLYGSNRVLEDESYNDFGLEAHRGEGKSLLWTLDPYSSLAYDFEKMPSYLALSFAMIQKHLSDVMPRNTLLELERFFQNADAKLLKEEERVSPQQYRQLKDSVEFYQRGQTLQAADFDVNVLDTIYRSILKEKQVKFQYRDKSYQVNPYGVVILLPKLYFIAKKVGDHRESSGFRSFLIHKISDIEVLSNRSSKAPDFSLKEYLEEGNMDVFISSTDRGDYLLRLKLNVDDGSHLIEDLTENPISKGQELTKLSDLSYQLDATVKRTVQLKNWIMGLGHIATVIEPQEIRRDITNELSSLMKNYKD